MRIRLLSFVLAFLALPVTTRAHFEDGQVWLIDFDNQRVYRVEPSTGAVTVPLDATDGLKNPGGMGFSYDWNMLVANYADDTIMEINGALFQGFERLQDLRSPGSDLHTMSVVEIKESEFRIENQV